MAQLEEKLNAILGNQEAMDQIMALARSLSGQERTAGAAPSEGEQEPETAPQAAAAPPPELSELLGQLDPEAVRVGLSVVRQVREGEDKNAALLAALRPFVREERRGRLDRALELVRTTRVLRAVLEAMGRGRREGV